MAERAVTLSISIFAWIHESMELFVSEENSIIPALSHAFLSSIGNQMPCLSSSWASPPTLFIPRLISAISPPLHRNVSHSRPSSLTLLHPDQVRADYSNYLF
jgi:hypothetical protein